MQAWLAPMLVGAVMASGFGWRAHRRLAAQLAACVDAKHAQEAEHQQLASRLAYRAQRGQAAIDRQLDLIVDLEQTERDPDALAALFSLDHLATQARRHAEVLLAVAGRSPGRRWSRMAPLHDVARAAVAEVDEYRRVTIAVDDRLALPGPVVVDVSHVLAELVDDALEASPPDKPVTLRALRPLPGEPCTIAVVDHSDGDVQLTQPDGLDAASALAAAHGIELSMSPTQGGGVTRLVRIPNQLVLENGMLVDRLPGGAMAAPIAAAPLRAVPIAAAEPATP